MIICVYLHENGRFSLDSEESLRLSKNSLTLSRASPRLQAEAFNLLLKGSKSTYIQNKLLMDIHSPTCPLPPPLHHQL